MRSARASFAAILPVLALLGGCAGSAQRPAPVQNVVLGEQQRPSTGNVGERLEGGTQRPSAAGTAQVHPLASSSIAPTPLQAPAGAGNGPAASPAVVALLNTAARQQRAGDTTHAVATLERALQIEPRNGWLWYRLGRLRLEQGKLEEAANLAARSLSLEPDNKELVAANWRLIATARARQGRAAEARVAQEKAAQSAGQNP